MASAAIVMSPEELDDLLERAATRALEKARPLRATEPDLTTEQAAQELQLRPKTVRRLARDGRIRGVRRGSTWRFPRTAIEAYRSGGPAVSVSDTLDRLGMK
jgi:excisionase family DNA binding protein